MGPGPRAGFDYATHNTLCKLKLNALFPLVLSHLPVFLESAEIALTNSDGNLYLQI